MKSVTSGSKKNTTESHHDLGQERSLSRRIIVLLIIASFLLIGQSLYNLSNLEQVDESIVTVHNAASSLEKLAREIATPIADIRMLSMETVLAPNQALVEETKRRLDQRIEQVELHLAEWHRRVYGYELVTGNDRHLGDGCLGKGVRRGLLRDGVQAHSNRFQLCVPHRRDRCHGTAGRGQHLVSKRDPTG